MRKAKKLRYFIIELSEDLETGEEEIKIVRRYNAYRYGYQKRNKGSVEPTDKAKEN